MTDGYREANPEKVKATEAERAIDFLQAELAEARRIHAERLVEIEQVHAAELAEARDEIALLRRKDGMLMRAQTRLNTLEEAVRDKDAMLRGVLDAMKQALRERRPLAVSADDVQVVEDVLSTTLLTPPAGDAEEGERDG